MLPAFPCPLVLANRNAPLLTEREPVVILIFPPFPTPSFPTPTKAWLKNPSLTPLKETVSVAVIVMLPASPFPFVLTSRKAPLVTRRESVSISISPPLPSAPTSTPLKAPLIKPSLPLPSKETISAASILTLPASPCAKVLATT